MKPTTNVFIADGTSKTKTFKTNFNIILTVNQSSIGFFFFLLSLDTWSSSSSFYVNFKVTNLFHAFENNFVVFTDKKKLNAAADRCWLSCSDRASVVLRVLLIILQIFRNFWEIALEPCRVQLDSFDWLLDGTFGSREVVGLEEIFNLERFFFACKILCQVLH